MKSHRVSSLVALSLLLALTAPLAAQKCPSVYHRVMWIEQGGQSFQPDQGPIEEVDHGKLVEIAPGDVVRIRTMIRNPKGNSNPFQPAVSYDYAGRQDRQVVTIQSDTKKPDVIRLGLVELRAQRGGSAALIYSMEHLDHPSQKAPAAALGNPACASGKIRITASETAPPESGPPAAAGSAFDRADLLYRAILLRPLGQGEADATERQLASGDLQRLVEVGRSIALSSESIHEVPRRLEDEIGRRDLVAETRTSRMLDLLVGKISTQDRLFQQAYQMVSQGRVADALRLALEDPRFLEVHGDLVSRGSHRDRRR